MTTFTKLPRHESKLGADCLAHASNNSLPRNTLEPLYILHSGEEREIDGLDRECHEQLVEFATTPSAQEPMLKPPRRAVSPLGRIPLELLSEIFLHYIDGPTIHLPPTPELCPWTLGHVCALWRRVLWGTPGVWKEIAVHKTLHPQKVCQPLNEILSRTTGLLDLTVHSDAGGPADITDLIFTSIHRFRDVSVQYLSPGCMVEFLNLPAGSIERLENLSVEIDYLSDQSPPDNLSHHAPAAFQTASSLRDLELMGEFFRPIAPPILFALASQLTGIFIDAKLSTSTVHSILSRLCHLETSLFSIVDDPAAERSASPILVPKLVFLGLDICGPINWDAFLHPLVLPALDAFSSTDYEELATPFPPSALSSLIRRSKCVITALQLNVAATDTVGLVDGEALEMLRDVPALASFKTGLFMSAAVFEEIKLGLLTQLNSGVFNVDPEGMRVFLEFLDLKAREQPGRSGDLSFELWCRDDIGFEEACDYFLERRTAYERAGINVDINSRPSMIEEVEEWTT